MFNDKRVCYRCIRWHPLHQQERTRPLVRGGGRGVARAVCVECKHFRQPGQVPPRWHVGRLSHLRGTDCSRPTNPSASGSGSSKDDHKDRLHFIHSGKKVENSNSQLPLSWMHMSWLGSAGGCQWALICINTTMTNCPVCADSMVSSPPRVVFSEGALRPTQPESSLSLRLDMPNMSHTTKSDDVHVKTRLTMLGRLSTTPLVLYPTEAHVKLMEFLLQHLEGLSLGYPTNGVHARTLVGAKGTGKSTLLRHFVEVVEALHPEVVAAYVTCTDSGTEHLLLPVARHLVHLNIIDSHSSVDAAVDGSKLHDLIMQSLYEKGKKLLLVVDEMDQLYRCIPQDAATFIPARRSLSSLASLGDRGGSVCAVLLCGSSAVLPLLITANGSRDLGIVSEYPTVRGAPNFNGQKCSVFRLPGGLPSSLDTARVVCSSSSSLGDGSGSGACDDRKAPLALFIAGSTTRLLQRAQESYSLKVIDQADDTSTSTPTLSGRSKALYEAIMADLRVTNADSMESVCPQSWWRRCLGSPSSGPCPTNTLPSSGGRCVRQSLNPPVLQRTISPWSQLCSRRF